MTVQFLAAVVLQRSLRNRSQGIEAADRIELLAQVGQHELDQAFGVATGPHRLGSLVLRLVARQQRRVGKQAHRCGDGQRDRGQRGHAGMAALSFAADQVVELQAQQPGGKLAAAVPAAVAARPEVGRDGFRSLLAEIAAIVQPVTQCLGKTLHETLARLVLRERFAIDNGRQDATFAVQTFELQDLLVDPFRLRGGGRTDHHQETAVAQGRLHLLGEVSPGRQVVAVAKDRRQARRHGTLRRLLAHQLARYPVRLQPAVEPATPALVGVAVADEGAITVGSHDRPAVTLSG